MNLTLPMTTANVSLPVLPASRPMRLTPTDVTQFVRLEQCERFLRFRLAERAGQNFMEEYDVIPQRITPLLSLSGHTFEEGIEADLAKRLPHRQLRRQVRQGPQPPGQQRRGRRRRPASCPPARPSCCSSPAWRPNSPAGCCGATWTSCGWSGRRTAPCTS